MKRLANKLGNFILWLVLSLFLTPPAWANGCLPEDLSFDDVKNMRLDRVVGCVLADILTFLITVSPAIIVIFLVIGGVKYMTSAGDERKLESARRFIALVVLGSIAILGAAAIFQFVLKYFLGIGS